MPEVVPPPDTPRKYAKMFQRALSHRHMPIVSNIAEDEAGLDGDD